MKIIWKLVMVLSVAALYIGYAHPDWIVDPTIALNVQATSPSDRVGSTGNLGGN